MALLNKLFSSRKKNYKHQDNVCERLFEFCKDQVQIILFKECDFRGRKLLFDSTAVKRTPLAEEPDAQPRTEKYVETSNGFGYTYTKPHIDIKQMGEMIFGSVAMSYRGTSYKIHSLNDPQRLMYTQVFPSPRSTYKCKRSLPSTGLVNTSSQNMLEMSVRLDDSEVSSLASMSGHFSMCSTSSEAVLVCRDPFRSVPVDVPLPKVFESSLPSPLNGDSGFSGDHSYSSISSAPLSMPLRDLSPLDVTFTSGSLYKRWLRSMSTSLERSGGHLNGSSSADECFVRTNPRTSKLGLTIIIQLTPDQEENMLNFLMEHASLVEAIVWRARHEVEVAYIRSHVFVSLMYEMSETIAQCVTDFFSGTQLYAPLWLSLASGCDKISSISVVGDGRYAESAKLSDLFRGEGDESVSLHNSLNDCDSLDKSSEFNFLNLTKFLVKTEKETVTDKKNLNRSFFAEKFVRELCELLETVDIKHTNFFISTLLTAVLTHHLGWVSTCLPQSSEDSRTMSDLHKPCNALWGQLTDLYGAVGHPTKVAHTIVTGTNKGEMISKILNSLTYFIRCNDVERRNVVRVDVTQENEVADAVCSENSCIPKENYKKFEDHLREMRNAAFCDQASDKFAFGKGCLGGKLKSKVPVFNNKLSVKETIDLNVFKDRTETDSSSFLFSKVNGFKNKCDRTVETDLEWGVKENDDKTQIKSCDTFQPVTNGFHNTETGKSGVIFTLGDDDQLIDLKTDKTINRSQPIGAVNASKGLKRNKTCYTLLNNRDHNANITLTEEIIPSSTEKTHSHLKPNEPCIRKQNSCIEFGVYEQKPKSAEETTGLKKSRPSTLNLQKEQIDFDLEAKPCSSRSGATNYPPDLTLRDMRSQSVPPGDLKSEHPKNSKHKYRYSGIKFNFQQYPQIAAQYLKSKNIELSDLPFAQKEVDSSNLSVEGETPCDYAQTETDADVLDALQTPSNASELEFISDLVVEKHKEAKAEETIAGLSKTYVRTKVPNVVIKEAGVDGGNSKEGSSIAQKMKTVYLPMPRSSVLSMPPVTIGYSNSLMRGLGDRYMSDMVLQGTSAAKTQWEAALRRDLILAARHSLLDQPVEEAVAIIANTDTWEVQIMSSHTYVVDKGSSGVRAGMSQLVANMLESLLHMWKLRTPAEYCLVHIEQRLQEFCERSQALAHLLLATELCSMDLLTSTLQLEVNDVPLLMSIASTHSPQVTQKYGLSFQ